MSGGRTDGRGPLIGRALVVLALAAASVVGSGGKALSSHCDPPAWSPGAPDPLVRVGDTEVRQGPTDGTKRRVEVKRDNNEGYVVVTADTNGVDIEACA